VVALSMQKNDFHERKIELLLA